MASRYPATHVLDYCFTPRTIWRDGEKFVVPCGKCDGCLLHKANVWSMRVGNEIDSSPYTIFATFTYSPRYLPTLKLVPSKNGFVWTSRHSHNIRFNGVQDVLRLDDIIIPSGNDNQLVRVPQNGEEGTISYASKSDFQLYMKMLRKCLKLKFQNTDEDYNIRYFTISEYGPTTYRNHIHSLFFVRSHQVAEFMLQSALFENWQMCDKDLFQQYTRFADNGTRNYVTNYVTGFSRLPEFLRQKEIRPFRLASKGFAIGFDSFDEVKVQESIFDGTLQYSKSVPRLESKFVFQYPKGYLASLFPKCYRYAKRDFGRLLEVYGALYTAASRSRGFISGSQGRKIYTLGLDSSRLRQACHSQDWQATKKCYEFCNRYLVTPFVYVSLLVDVYYKLDMSNLKRWYLMQQLEDSHKQTG